MQREYLNHFTKNYTADALSIGDPAVAVLAIGPMATGISLIGYGEAARTFVCAGLKTASAFDIDPVQRDGFAAHDNLYDVLGHAKFVISLVTADQALIAAKQAASCLVADALYFDMNSVAPQTKRAAARVIKNAGGRYIDVAIMAPVLPKKLAVPVLVSGPHAEEGAAALRNFEFTSVRVVGPDVGRASGIKMIRSVMIKGIEALTAEMMLAARAAGVSNEVLTSLGDEWDAKAAYNLERMATHGVRRAVEMEEAAKTLVALGVDPVMTRSTIVRQRAMAA